MFRLGLLSFHLFVRSVVGVVPLRVRCVHLLHMSTFSCGFLSWNNSNAPLQGGNVKAIVVCCPWDPYSRLDGWVDVRLLQNAIESYWSIWMYDDYYYCCSRSTHWHHPIGTINPAWPEIATAFAIYLPPESIFAQNPKLNRYEVDSKILTMYKVRKIYQ